MDDADELLMLYDGPTAVLDGRDLPSIAKFMKSPQCKRVFVMVRIFFAFHTCSDILWATLQLGAGEASTGGTSLWHFTHPLTPICWQA